MFASKLAVKIQLKLYTWQPATVFLHDAKYHKYWIAMRYYTSYRSSTNSMLTFCQKVLVFLDGKQSFEPCPIVLCGVSLQHKQFLCTQSAVTEHKGFLQLKCSTTERHTSVSYVQFTGHRTPSQGYDNDIVAKHNVEIHDTSLTLYSYAHYSLSLEHYIAVT